MSEPLFDLKSVDLEYQQRKILSDISFSIHAGERIALIGPSGAGKSTLLKHLRSLLPAQVAWCPQHTGLVPMLSAFHNIYMGALSRHNTFYNLLNLVYPLQQPKKEIQQLSDLLQLEKAAANNILFQSADSLSGGQQQRIAIGRALYQNKNIFIGDEPVSAVDDYQADHLLNMICQRHNTVILALHDIEQALKTCTRIIGIKDGHIAFDKNVDDIESRELQRLYKT